MLSLPSAVSPPSPGITSWDCADHYGPAEALIGRYLKEHPAQVANIQV